MTALGPYGRIGVEPGSAYAPMIDDAWPRPAHVATLVLESPAYLNGRMVAVALVGAVLGCGFGVALTMLAVRL